MQDYTTTRRPTQHDAQYTAQALNGTRSATHVCRQPAIPRPHARPPVHTSTATTSAYDGPNSPHTASPNDHCLSISDLVMVLRGCFGFGAWFGSVLVPWSCVPYLSCTSNPQTRRCVAYATAGTLLPSCVVCTQYGIQRRALSRFHSKKPGRRARGGAGAARARHGRGFSLRKWPFRAGGGARQKANTTHTQHGKQPEPALSVLPGGVPW